MTAKYQRTPPLSLAETYRAFFDALQANSLEELVRTAFQVFGLPVVLHDESSRLLYQYPQTFLGEKMWDLFLQEQDPDVTLLRKYQEAMLANKSAGFLPFYYRPEDPSESGYILGQVHYQGKTYGYFTLFLFGEAPDDDDLARAKIFANALSIIFFHRNLTSTVSLNATLYDALAEEKSALVRFQAVETLTKQTTGSYVLIVKPIGSSASQSTYATMSVRHMPAMRSNIVMTICHDCLVILYGNIHGNSYITSEYEAIVSIESYLRPAGMGCGVSALFHTLDQLSEYFAQAYMTALSSTKFLEFYEKIVPVPIFQLASTHPHASAFLAPVLSVIHQYDVENSTEYFETLRTYSLLLHNKEHTAAALCIHRNTLLYRLNRIRDIFEVPYEDPQSALHLLNSFQLWDIIHRDDP